MSSVAALPLVSTSIAHSPDCVPTADRRLVELAASVVQIYQRYETALDEENSKWDAYKEPQRPIELGWRFDDPVGFFTEHVSSEIDEGGVVRRRGRMWCRPSDIEKLRGKPLMRWEFVGTDEQWRRNESHYWDSEGNGPAPESAHLWAQVPDARRQPRADELIAALHRWESACAELQRKLGLPELQDNSDALAAQLSAIEEEMLTLPATTLEGLRAKAMVLFRVLWDGDGKDQLIDTLDSKFIYSLVGDLIGYDPCGSSQDGEQYCRPGGPPHS